jgi:SAM-dependent methyltransferase
MFSRSARLYDAIYGSFKDFGAEAERLHHLVQQHKPRARSLLDVACGTGAHLAHLAPRYDVEGLDLDPGMLTVARERLPAVPLHEADMVDFDLGRCFDAVVCLFSSIGYARTRERLERAAASMARHLEPGGVLVLEPWVLPEQWDPSRVHAVFVDEPDLKVARMSVPPPLGPEVELEFHYLVGRRDGVEHFAERHVLGMFTHDDYVAALRAAGLEVEHDPDGLTGRGLYFGARGT